MSIPFKIIVGDTVTPQHRVPKSGVQAYLAPVVLKDVTGIEEAFEVRVDIQQSGTAGYNALLVNVMESSVGAGVRLPIEVKVDTLSKFSVDMLGAIIGMSFGGILSANLLDKTAAETITGDYTFTGAFTSVGIDDNATVEMLQISDAAIVIGTTGPTEYPVYKADDTGILNLSGGNAAAAGGNIRLFAGVHATQANDIEIRGGAVVQALYDDSASLWDFQANEIKTSGKLTSGELSNNTTLIVQATVDDVWVSGASDVTLVSGAESVQVRTSGAGLKGVTIVGTDLLLQTAGDLVINATGGIRMGSAAGPIWITGAGTPEGALTAPIGSLYTRTDGGAGTTLYVKESGVGNTGWVAK